MSREKEQTAEAAGDLELELALELALESERLGSEGLESERLGSEGLESEKPGSKRSGSERAGIQRIVEVRNLVKDYGMRGFQTRVLKGIDLAVYQGDFIAIMGPSGSGKTTLLNILSSVDKPTLGDVLLDGRDITRLSNTELSRIRRDKIGFIFQDYNLLDTMSLKDNIALPLTLNGVSGRDCSCRVEELAALFGLKDHLEKYPYQLSGGQKQRGAAARALITGPEIIFADEPTGALDSKSGKDLLDALKRVNDEGKATILMVTHDACCASYAKDVYILSDGAMKCRISRGGGRKEFYDRIMETQVSMGGDFT